MPSACGGGGGYSVGDVGRRVLEGDVTPDVERGPQLRRPAGRPAQDLWPLFDVVAALVASLDHDFDGDPVGGGARGHPHRVPDGAAAELQHDVLAQVA